MMKTLKIIVPLTLATLMLAACSDRGDLDMPVGVDRDDVVATVNGQPIPRALFEMFLEQRTGGQAIQLNDEQRQNLIDELVEMELLVQAAQKQGIHREPELAMQLLGSYKSNLARVLLQRHLQEAGLDEEDLRQAYQDRAESGEREYQARHILVETEVEARDIITELDAGGDFAALARQYSADDGSSEEGGSLGWFVLNDMVPNFSEALRTMEEDTYTEEPVQTRFGWHVILLEGTRARELPAYEDMREELAQDLRYSRIEALVNELREDAKIRVHD